MEGVIAKAKEKNNGLLAKLDDMNNHWLAKLRRISRIQGRVEGAAEELEAERQARAQAERHQIRKIDQLGGRLDEAGGATVAQVELNKKRIRDCETPQGC